MIKPKAMIISEKLRERLLHAGISEEQFEGFVKAEGFTQDEIDDIGYMKDKIDIWSEGYELFGHYNKNRLD